MIPSARRSGMARNTHRQAPTNASTAPKRAHPRLTILIPSAGGRARVLHHWGALLDLQYSGTIEVVILVHSRDDPSFCIAEQLLKSSDGRVKVCVTGHASSCSQKIHNLCYGIQRVSEGCGYILCMDDDAHIHSTMLCDMVQALEADPAIFMATGYPFDIPTRQGASVFAYAILAFHFKLIIPFSFPKVSNVWGGCMLFRCSGLKEDRYGLVKAWRAGGYSDDMTAAAICAQNNLRIHSPASAVFLQSVDADTGFSDCWNYICRQMFVLDTYANMHNRVLNHLLMCLSALDALLTVAAAAILCIKSLAGTSCAIKLFLAVSLPTVSHQDFAVGVLQCTVSQCDAVTIVMIVMFAAMYVSSIRFSSIVIEAIRVYAPEQCPKESLSYQRIWIGVLLHSILTPAAIIFNLLRSDVLWSGIQYKIRAGRVVQVVHHHFEQTSPHS